jgi:CheY-like chemotaxis protein
LVANAVEAAGPDKPPHVHIGREALGPAELASAQVNPGVPPGEYAFVQVTDTSPGMTADVLARAFEPFFTTRPRGRGLGLSVVAGVVKAHGGALRIRTAPGAGTTVRLWLPPAAPDMPASAPATRFRPGTRVLVVDDEDLVRGVVKAMLERKGCAVLTAANGRDAVDVMRREADRVDAVLLDLNMPVMDGERALEEIRALSPAVPVWIMTGYDPAGREERLAGHVRGVLRKPVSSETLFLALSAVLGT